ncbi:MAG: hypothetical protein V4671_14565 [Armatimonadota bacterium]
MEQQQLQQINHFQRLLWWNRFWLGLLVLVGLSWLISREIAGRKREMQSLRLSWASGGRGLAIDPGASDGPFLVTHLVSDGTNEGEKRFAVLPEPIVITDSEGGALIPPEVLGKLVWRFSITGEAASAPVGGPLSALFFRPEQSKQAEETEGIYKAAPSP